METQQTVVSVSTTEMNKILKYLRKITRLLNSGEYLFVENVRNILEDVDDLKNLASDRANDAVISKHELSSFLFSMKDFVISAECSIKTIVDVILFSVGNGGALAYVRKNDLYNDIIDCANVMNDFLMVTIDALPSKRSIKKNVETFLITLIAALNYKSTGDIKTACDFALITKIVLAFKELTWARKVILTQINTNLNCMKMKLKASPLAKESCALYLVHEITIANLQLLMELLKHNLLYSEIEIQETYKGMKTVILKATRLLKIILEKVPHNIRILVEKCLNLME